MLLPILPQSIQPGWLESKFIQIRKALPRSWLSGSVPQNRLSSLRSRLSPITK